MFEQFLSLPALTARWRIHFAQLSLKTVSTENTIRDSLGFRCRGWYDCNGSLSKVLLQRDLICTTGGSAGLGWDTRRTVLFAVITDEALSFLSNPIYIKTSSWPNLIITVKQGLEHFISVLLIFIRLSKIFFFFVLAVIDVDVVLYFCFQMTNNK